MVGTSGDLITVMLAVLVLATSASLAVEAPSMICVTLWGIGLLYFVVRRW